MKPTLAVVAALFFSAPAFAGPLTAKGTQAVELAATGSAGMSFVGKTPDLTVADDGTKVTFTVPLKNVDTGINLRNEHMRTKYLETDKFPNATLEVAKADLKFPDAGKDSEADVNGTCTIHGVPKPVTVHYKASRASDGTLTATGKFKINIKDYGITVVSYLGVRIDSDMNLTVKLSATDG